MRSTWWHPDLLAALMALEEMNGSGFHFPGAGNSGHVHLDTVYAVIQRTVGVHPHALRHAAATAPYRQTHDLQAVQAFLGHASLATTQTYLHVSEAQMDTLARAVSLVETV